jgi:hypothetical protein
MAKQRAGRVPQPPKRPDRWWTRQARDHEVAGGTPWLDEIAMDGLLHSRVLFEILLLEGEQRRDRVERRVVGREAEASGSVSTRASDVRSA